MLRFVQIGDVHLARHERNAERVRALDQIIDAELQQPVAAWLLPGDLDDALMTVENKNIWTTRVVRMAEHAPVVIVPGNHDTPGDLDFLAHLRARFPIAVVTSPQVIRVRLAASEMGRRIPGPHTAAIFCFPYPSRHGLVAAGTPSELVPVRAREVLEVLFIHAAAELQAAIADGCVPLMIGHVNVGGSRMSSGQPNIGKEIELDPTLLERLGPIPKLLSHIHRPQEIGGAHYAGSICRMDFGEVEPKRYLVIEYEPTWEGDGWTYVVESIPVDIPPRYDVKGVLTREGFDWHLTGCAHLASTDAICDCTDDFVDGEVRVRYTYTAAEKDVLDFALVDVPFAGAIRLVKDPIPQHTRALRAPEVAEATTDDAKVAAYVRGAGIDWSSALEHKFALLALPDATVFANTLEADVSGAAGWDETPVVSGEPSDDRAAPDHNVLAEARP